MTFEEIVQRVKALGLKWTVKRDGRLQCEKGDCVFGAYMRVESPENSYVSVNGLSGLNPRDTIVTKEFPSLDVGLVRRIMNANDGPGRIYPIDETFDDDVAYLRNELNALEDNTNE